MNDTFARFVATMTAFVLMAALVQSWIRTRGGAKVAVGGPEEAREIEQLSSENAGLKGQVSRLEERIAVLERIVTDPADRTAREIENLR